MSPVFRAGLVISVCLLLLALTVRFSTKSHDSSATRFKIAEQAMTKPQSEVQASDAASHPNPAVALAERERPIRDNFPPVEIPTNQIPQPILPGGRVATPTELAQI